MWRWDLKDGLVYGGGFSLTGCVIVGFVARRRGGRGWGVEWLAIFFGVSGAWGGI